MLARLLILGIAIGSNNLAASLALGALGQKERIRCVVVVFGCFEFAVPLAGLWLGQQSGQWIEGHVHWMAPVMLATLGVWTLWAAWRSKSADKSFARRVTTWGGLFVLAAGLSVDNLVVGFSLGLRESSPLLLAGTIAAFSMGFAWLGMHLGSQARRHWERYAEFGAAALLFGLAGASWLGWI